MEAMATGLPVVSTRIGGIPEMVVENETGFLVQPDDVVALAGAIEKLTNERSLGQRLGQAGYERAQRLFSIENNLRELCALVKTSTDDCPQSPGFDSLARRCGGGRVASPCFSRLRMRGKEGLLGNLDQPHQSVSSRRAEQFGRR